MDDVGQQVVLGQQLAAAGRLGAPLLGERDVHPSGEEVLLVPVALPVAEQNEVIAHLTAKSFQYVRSGYAIRVAVRAVGGYSETAGFTSAR
ncbi:hypothetical protein GCM10027060_07760 [Nesterenkonia halophila]